MPPEATRGGDRLTGGPGEHRSQGQAAGGSPQRLGSARWEALGTGVLLLVADPTMIRPARIAVERELAVIDSTLSRFRADSELSRANAYAGRSVRASPLLIEALQLAVRAAVLTDGDVDPTLGRALELIGYDRDHSRLPTPTGAPLPATTISARSRPGWRTLTIDPNGRTFRTAPGIKLDLGATAKAWAADRAAAAAAAASGCGVLVGIGGDIASSGAVPEGGWEIRVTDDHRSEPTAPGQSIRIFSGGLATSSTAVRRWSHHGRTMHHILDPRTGLPVAGEWRTVSVAAATCADANIATTASIVRGRAAIDWLSALMLPARLVDHSGQITTLGDWPPDTGDDAHPASGA